MLASLRCNLTLNEAGVGFPSFVEDFKPDNEDNSSVHRAFRFAEEVRESAVSTVLRKVARNRSRHSSASLNLAGIS